MSEYKDKQKTATKTTEEDAPLEVEDLRDEELTGSIESILDEIDEVLEENAQEFVEQYIQKGGQ